MTTGLIVGKLQPGGPMKYLIFSWTSLQAFLSQSHIKHDSKSTADPLLMCGGGCGWGCGWGGGGGGEFVFCTTWPFIKIQNHVMTFPCFQCGPLPNDGVQAWVSELCGSVVVVHKVNPARNSAPNLPAHRQWSEFLATHTSQIPARVAENQSQTSASTARGRLGSADGGSVPRYPGVVPGADTCLRVEEVHLALHRRSLLYLDKIMQAFTGTLLTTREQQNLVGDSVRMKLELTISLWQVGWLVAMRPVLGSVAVSSRVLPPASLNTALLIRRIQTTVSAPCSPGGVGVGQGLLAETSLKDRPENTVLYFY